MRGAIAISSSRGRSFHVRQQCGGSSPAVRPRVQPDLPTPTRHPDLRISNRESLRLEIDLNQRKQTTDHRSNRENNALFSNHDLTTHRPNLKISNREPLRLETDLTQTKQTTDSHSNREKQTVFKSACRSGPAAPFTDAPPGFLPRAKPRGRPSAGPSFLPPQPTPRPQFTDPNPNYKPPQKSKNTKIPLKVGFG
jgi:hypothetical protein